MRALILICSLLALGAAFGPFLVGRWSRSVNVWQGVLAVDAGLMFFRRGKSSARVVLVCADPAAPTAAELAAGVDLSAAVAAIGGFETSLNRINQPVMKYAEELQIDGPQTFADASMTLLEDDGTGADADSTARQDAYIALDEQTTGWMALAPKKGGTLIIGDDVEMWPFRVGARNRGWGLETEASRYVVQFAITGKPEKDAVVT